MIRIQLERGSDGRLLRCSASGHANTAPKGADTVCAAVSILLRTVALTLADYGSTLRLADRGEFFLETHKAKGTDNVRLCFAGDFLETGLESLQEEFPNAVAINTRIVQ